MTERAGPGRGLIGTLRTAVPAVWLVVVLVAAVVAAGLVSVGVLAGPERYESHAALVIDSPVELAAARDSGVIDKLGRLRLKYAALAETEVIAGRAAESLDAPVGAVLGATEVVVGQSTLTLGVVGRGPDPETARASAAAMSAAIVSFVEQEHIENDIPPRERFFFEVVSEPRGAAQVAPSARRAATSAALAFGLVLAAGVLFARPWRAWTSRIDGSGTDGRRDGAAGGTDDPVPSIPARRRLVVARPTVPGADADDA